MPLFATRHGLGFAMQCVIVPSLIKQASVARRSSSRSRDATKHRFSHYLSNFFSILLLSFFVGRGSYVVCLCVLLLYCFSLPLHHGLIVSLSCYWSREISGNIIDDDLEHLTSWSVFPRPRAARRGTTCTIVTAVNLPNCRCHVVPSAEMNKKKQAHNVAICFDC